MIASFLFLAFLPSILSFGVWPNMNKFPLFQYLENFYENNQYLPSKSILLHPKVNSYNLTEHDKYQSQWYSIGQKSSFPFRVPRKITIWGKQYVIWKKSSSEYACLSDTCPHGGDSLSNGHVYNNCITCSQHKNSFNENGEFVSEKTGLLEGSQLYELPHFQVVEKNDMLYLNTYENVRNSTILYRDFPFVNSEFRQVFIESNVNIHPTILMENSLDVVHIIFAKLFTNKNTLEPDSIDKIHANNSLHYGVKYTYERGKNSLINKLFDSHELTITSEVINPFTTISRVMVKDKELVFETNIRPIQINKSKVYVRCYRNFRLSYGGDKFINEVIQKIMDVYTQMSFHNA